MKRPQPGLGILDPGTTCQIEEQTGYPVSQPALPGNVFPGKLSFSQDQCTGTGAPCLSQPEDVGDTVLPVAVCAYDLGIRLLLGLEKGEGSF